jgi:hypothetical protein
MHSVTMEGFYKCATPITYVTLPVFVRLLYLKNLKTYLQYV